MGSASDWSAQDGRAIKESSSTKKGQSEERQEKPAKRDDLFDALGVDSDDLASRGLERTGSAEFVSGMMAY